MSLKCQILISEFVSYVRQLFAADDFSRRHFSGALFLGALRVKQVSGALSMKVRSIHFHLLLHLMQ